MLENIKSFVRDTLAIPPSLILVCAGIIAHLLLCLILRKPYYSAWGLLAPLVLGMLIESYEIWSHYKEIGLFAASNDPVLLIFFRHSLDIVKMLMLPLLLVIFGKITSVTANNGSI